MKMFSMQKSTLALLALLAPLLVLFVYVALRSGPLAPVPVTLATVENRSLAPALFGIGSVESRYSYKIGPTMSGRVKRLNVHVGEEVRAGQVLGEMDPVDLGDRVRAQTAALKRAAAQIGEAQARESYAQTQAQRYEQLLAVKATSAETVATKQQERQVAVAGLSVAREEFDRIRAEHEALLAQRNNLLLIAPVAGLVVSRAADPGTTVVAGQPVVEVIDPNSLWINVRFDQMRAHGLAANLPARIALRSQTDAFQTGRVLRVEPLADVVTEELLAKVVFERLPVPLPPVGELAEVTVELPALAPGPVIPNAAIQRRNGRTGVWQIEDGELRFTPVTLGPADLDGAVLVREGLKSGDKVVVYSGKALNEHSPIHVVERLPGVTP